MSQMPDGVRDKDTSEGSQGGYSTKGQTRSSSLGDVQSPRKKHKWVIVTDPHSRFTDQANPFFVYRERTTLALVTSPASVKAFDRFLGYLAYVLPLGLALELVGAYGVTELLPNKMALMPLLAAVLRLPYFLRLNTDLLGLLCKKYEFWLLIISCCLGTIGLMDAFSYDIRCALAVDFLTIGTYAACEDAANKYSKKSPSVQGYVLGTFVLYLNLSIVLLLIYFGFVPNLVNRTIFLPIFPSSTEVLPVNATLGEASGFTVGSLNITLGLVQGILIYLFKSPYRLNRNELAILQVPLFAKKVNLREHGIEERYRFDTAARVQRAFTAGTQSEVDFEEGEHMESRASSSAGDASKAVKLTGIDPNKRFYRIAPTKSEFVVAGAPFQWDRKDTVASRLVGEKWSTFCFKVLYFNLTVQAIMAIYAFTFFPLFLLVLINVLPRDVSWISIPGYVLLTLYFNTLNYTLLGKVLKTTGVRIMLFLMFLGNLGFAFAFNFDARTAGMLGLSAAFFIFVGFSDARIRSRVINRYALFMYSYIFLSFIAILVCFYVNAIVDVEDVDIDLAALAGKNSTLQLSMVGYSLYSVEIVVLYLARKYYSIMFKNGFSSLEIRLRYFVQDMKDAVSSPYADSGRISTFVDPRKLSALIQNSKTKQRANEIGDVQPETAESLL